MVDEQNIYAEAWKSELFKRDEDYFKDDLIHYFLPQDTVTLAMKIANLHNLSAYSEFSMLDTLQHGLTHCRDIIDNSCNKKKIVMLLINIIRLSEKMNDSESIITHISPCNILQVLGISDDELNKFEFPVFKSMGFKVIPPIILELVQHFVTTCASPFITHPDFIFTTSVDLLRSAYLQRDLVYERYLENLPQTMHWSIKQDRLLLAAACLVSTMIALNVPPEVNVKVMDLLIEESKRPWNNLELLGGIIFDSLIKR